MAEQARVSLLELSRHSGSELWRGNPATQISGAALLDEADAGDLVYLVSGHRQNATTVTRAGAVLTTLQVAEQFSGDAALLVSEDPEIAFIACLELLYPAFRPAPGVHSHAVVENDVELGAGTTVGAATVIETGVKIGRDCQLGAGIYVGRGVTVGDHCVLHPNVTLYPGVTLHDHVILHSGAVIGSDGYGYKYRKGVHVKFPQVGTVVIESHVEIGANACVDRAALGKTVIGAGAKIDNLVHVAHNCQLGRGVLLAGQTGLGGSTVLGDYVFVAAQSGISDHIKVGAGAKLFARAGVTRDVPDGVEVFGFPAQERTKARQELGALRRLATLYKPLRRLVSLLPAIERRLDLDG